MNDQVRRDHRDINQDLPVFATDPLAGAGLPLWLPDGAVIREELQRLAKDLARADGCQSGYAESQRKKNHRTAGEQEGEPSLSRVS